MKRHKQNTTYYLLALIAIFGCKSYPPAEIPSNTQDEVINLNNIAMVPHKNYKLLQKTRDGNVIPDDVETIKFQKNSQGKYCIVLDLTFKDSGFNIIESIKNGEVLDNKIVIRDSAGRIVGQDSINFQAFSVSKTIVAKVEKNEVLTDTGDRISLDEKEKKEKAKYNIEHISYTSEDKIPQPICLKTALQSGSYISIAVELTYVQPYLREVCFQGKSGCNVIEKEVMIGPSQYFQKKIAEKEDEIKANPEKNTRFAYKQEDWEKGRDSIKTAIKRLLARLSLLKEPEPTYGHYVKYREFKLLGAPRYFKVTSE